MFRLRLCPLLALLLSAFALDAQPLARLLGYFPEDFFRGYGMSPPAIAPDGKTVAFLVSSRDRNQIRLFHVEDGRESVLHSTDSGDQSFRAAAWAGSSRLVYQDQRGNWYSIETPHGQPQRIFNSRGYFVGWGIVAVGDFHTAQLFSRMPEDNDHILLQTRDRRGRAQVVRVQLSSGDESVVQRAQSNIEEWIPSLSGDVVAGTRFTRNQVEFRYRPPGTRRWQNLDHFVPERAHSFSYSGRSHASRRFQFLMFGADNHTLYFASNTGTNTNAIYRMDVRSGELVRLAHDPVYDLFSDHNPGQGLVFSAESKDVVGIHYHQEKPHTLWLSERFQSVQDRIDAQIPDQINRILSFDRAEKRFIFATISSRSKGQFYLYDRDQDGITELGAADSRLNPDDLAVMRPVSFEGRHGHTLPGYLTLPNSTTEAEPSTTPLVVLVHGGPWVRDLYGYHPEVQFLANKGYGVLQVNFRGSTGYGFEHFDAIRQRFGSVAVEDIEDALDAVLVDYPQLNAEAVAVMGSSFGAYAGMNLLLSRPNSFRAGILMMGLYDIEKQVQHVKDKDREYASGYWDEMVGGAWDSDALRGISPIHRIEELQVPVLVIHGEQDNIVPVEQSRTLVRKLQEYDKPHQSYLMRTEGHGIEAEREVIAVYSRVLDFLESNLEE